MPTTNARSEHHISTLYAETVTLSFCSIVVPEHGVVAFMRSYPRSGLSGKPIVFEFDRRNGDLVDLYELREDGTRGGDPHDGPALLALSQDAARFAATQGLCPID